jgi:4-hydroxybenzoate polyprenyltransferase
MLAARPGSPAGWPVGGSRALPGGVPAWGQVGLIILCMIAARSFAMTFNRLADAEIDARNPRTAGRPLQTGRIARKAAWAMLLAAGGAFLAGCAGFLAYGNPWPLRLALPVLVFLALYSYTKRFTSLSHFVLGAALAIAPAATWLAINPATIGLATLLLSAAVVLWVAGFDIIYACQDIEVDRREGLFSLPARRGPRFALWVSRACHFLTILLLASLGRLARLGGPYWIGLGMVAILLVFEQSLVRPNNFSRVTLAFFNVNGCVSLFFAAAVVADSVWQGKMYEG